MPPDLALLSTLTGSNYLCLELIFMVPKVFEPLKFDCSLQCLITKFFYLTVTDSMYEVTLVREDMDGNSFPVAAEFQASEAPQPPAPVNLHLTMSTVDSISVQWYQPHSDMEILQYTIKYYELLRNDIHGNSNIQTR